jgi:hypothetical protein
MNGSHHKTRMSSLIKHLNEAHDQDLSHEHLTFETDELFNEWLWETERVQYHVHSTKYDLRGKKTTCTTSAAEVVCPNITKLPAFRADVS